MRILAGLGNPGYEYALTRHNVGWMVIDQIVDDLRAGTPRESFASLSWGPLISEGIRTLLLKPLTFMNLSGKAVAEAARYYEVPPEDILIICDDIALPFGALRLRRKGSSGGQKGLESVLGAFRTLDIPRLRVGVGAQPEGRDRAAWVLGVFGRNEREILPDVIRRAADGCLSWMRMDIQKAMSVVNAPTS